MNNARIANPLTDSEPGENVPLEKNKNKNNNFSDFYQTNSSSMNNARISNPIEDSEPGENFDSKKIK